MAQVTIYTTTFCPFCLGAKRMLDALGVPYRDVSLDRDRELRRRLSEQNDGWRTVPMIFVGERFVGGFDDLRRLHRSGELEELLRDTPTEETAGSGPAPGGRR